jgi:hypothetical protein
LADEKLTFLMEVELPPYCFLTEAVDWVAFGRVPQMQHHSDGSTDDSVDFRFDWREMPDNFEPHFIYPWFERPEFESLGIPVTEAYFSAAEKCFSEFVTELPKRIAEYEAKEPMLIEREDGSTIDFYEKSAKEYRLKLAELGPLQSIVDEVEAQFKPYYDVACAKLFQLLALGEIKCQSLNLDRWERVYDDGNFKEAALFEEVPSSAFSLDRDWRTNELELEGERHGALRVATQDILRNRTVLLQSGKPISVERFGAFYISRDTARTTRRAKAGRRSVVDWKLLQSRLEEMARSDALPEGKESCIYELIAFAESELGKGPSRTAVQRNLRHQLDALYAQS